MSPSTFERVGQAIAHLDVSAENARIEDLRTEAARLQEAIDKAEARRSEIRRGLAECQSQGAQAVAEALLDGKDAMHAAREGLSEADLKAEQEALRGAIGDLQNRIAVTRRQVEEIQSSCSERAAACLVPLVDELMVDLRSSAENILSGFAALSAIGDATRGYARARRAAELAVPGLHTMDGLLASQKYAEPPLEVAGLLRQLGSKGPAFPARFRETVPLPF